MIWTDKLVHSISKDLVNLSLYLSFHQVGTPPPPEEATATLQKVIGPLPHLVTEGHLLGITLMSTNGYLHPCIMYGK